MEPSSASRKTIRNWITFKILRFPEIKTKLFRLGITRAVWHWLDIHEFNKSKSKILMKFCQHIESLCNRACIHLTLYKYWFYSRRFNESNLHFVPLVLKPEVCTEIVPLISSCAHCMYETDGNWCKFMRLAKSTISINCVRNPFYFRTFLPANKTIWISNRIGHIDIGVHVCK